MRTLIGILLLIAAVLGGLYVGLYLCLFGGIMQVIEGIKANPTSGVDVACGIVRIVCTSLAGWATFAVGALISAAFMSAGRFRRW